jgi:hypothetical protein
MVPRTDGASLGSVAARARDVVSPARAGSRCSLGGDSTFMRWVQVLQWIQLSIAHCASHSRPAAPQPFVRLRGCEAPQPHNRLWCSRAAEALAGLTAAGKLLPLQRLSRFTEVCSGWRHHAAAVLWPNGIRVIQRPVNRLMRTSRHASFVQLPCACVACPLGVASDLTHMF